MARLGARVGASEQDWTNGRGGRHVSASRESVV